ncbi:MAG: hypothetical protein Q9162_000923 [Coniocarpon cinnabarinum]
MHLLRSASNLEASIALTFGLFGLINNVLYVVILSAAVDLVPANVPKGIVLFADILPAFAAKLVAPYFINVIPYGARLFLCAVLSAAGMLLVAHTPSIVIKLFGIGIASLSSGLGELTFLGLTHFYGRSSLAGFSSGTGAAGLVGAGYYAFATTSLGISTQVTIDLSAMLPAFMLLGYSVGLPSPKSVAYHSAVYSSARPRSDTDRAEERTRILEEEPAVLSAQQNVHSTLSAQGCNSRELAQQDVWTDLHANLGRARRLIYPYMLPLFLVYSAEYVAISAVAPTLLFPTSQSPFKNFRDFYPAYQALYQAGVFISRSSILFLRLKNIYTPSLLQIVNLAILILQALLYFLPSVWMVFGIFFWTGLLGGAVYVNAFAKISDEVEEYEREFSLSATTVADSTGILLASVTALTVEPGLCGYQKAHGRTWCELV